MPMTSTTSTTEYTLTEPMVISAGGDHSVVVEQAIIITATPSDDLHVQVLVHGYVVDADGTRTGSRVFSTPITDPDQRTALIAHVLKES